MSAEHGCHDNRLSWFPTAFQQMTALTQGGIAAACRPGPCTRAEREDDSNAAKIVNKCRHNKNNAPWPTRIIFPCAQESLDLVNRSRSVGTEQKNNNFTAPGVQTGTDFPTCKTSRQHTISGPDMYDQAQRTSQPAPLNNNPSSGGFQLHHKTAEKHSDYTPDYRISGHTGHHHFGQG